MVVGVGGWPAGWPMAMKYTSVVARRRRDPGTGRELGRPARPPLRTTELTGNCGETRDWP